MIYLLEQNIRSTITGLNFVERYGGIVRPVTVERAGRDGNRFSDVYPVSRYANLKTCFDTGDNLDDLIPDDRYKSIAYWEQRSNVDVVPGGAKDQYWRAAVDLRLVVWLNLYRLGLTNYADTDKMELQALKEVRNLAGTQIVDGVYRFAIHSVNPRPVIREPRNVFAPYSYNEKEWAFHFPYSFFAVDFTFNLMFAAGCIQAVELGEESECITTW